MSVTHHQIWISPHTFAFNKLQDLFLSMKIIDSSLVSQHDRGMLNSAVALLSFYCTSCFQCIIHTSAEL